MRNAIPPRNDLENSLALRSVERSTSDRYSSYVVEIQRLIDAGRKVMQRRGSVDPRVSEIVIEAGLSNQAFYRHFRSKNELLLAILDDGVDQLITYLESCMAKERITLGRVERWIRCICRQATDAGAAASTRPFVVQGVRLSDQFPEETARSTLRIKAPLQATINEVVAQGEAPLCDPERDTELIYHLAIGWMQRKIIERAVPTEVDVDNLVSFCVRGLLGRDANVRIATRGA